MVPSLTIPWERQFHDTDDVWIDADASLTRHEGFADTNYRSRRDLLKFAHAHLRDLAIKTGVSDVEPHRRILRLLNAVIADGSPTPQVGDNGEGGIEVEWLVNGKTLRLDYEDESEILLEARNADASLIFSETVTAWWLPGDSAIVAARDFLESLAPEVARPLTLS